MFDEQFREIWTKWIEKITHLKNLQVTSCFFVYICVKEKKDCMGKFWMSHREHAPKHSLLGNQWFPVIVLKTQTVPFWSLNRFVVHKKVLLNFVELNSILRYFFPSLSPLNLGENPNVWCENIQVFIVVKKRLICLTPICVHIFKICVCVSICSHILNHSTHYKLLLNI